MPFFSQAVWSLVEIGNARLNIFAILESLIDLYFGINYFDFVKIKHLIMNTSSEVIKKIPPISLKGLIHRLCGFKMKDLCMFNILGVFKQ